MFLYLLLWVALRVLVVMLCLRKWWCLLVCLRVDWIIVLLSLLCVNFLLWWWLFLIPVDLLGFLFLSSWMTWRKGRDVGLICRRVARSGLGVYGSRTGFRHACVQWKAGLLL